MSSYSELNSRIGGKEQYYTRPDIAMQCSKIAMPFIKNRAVLEPAGGRGDFIDALISQGIKDIVSYDLEPKHSLVQEKDFFEVSGLSNVFTIGNPPFGRNSALSVRFFNHAAEMSDYIGFIIPKSWRKWSLQNRLDNRFHLVKDIELSSNTFYNPKQEEYGSKINSVFQIWEKRSTPRGKISIADHGFIKRSIPERANVVIVYAGYGAGKVLVDFDNNKRNTTYMYLEAKPKVIKALQNMDYSAMLANCAYNPSLNFEEIKFLLNTHFNKES